MRVSKTLISSAAAAAIVSVIGLAYAETSATGDTAQMQAETRSDTSARSTGNDATAPTGTMQTTDSPAAPIAPATGGADTGTSSSGNGLSSGSMATGTSSMSTGGGSMSTGTSSMPGAMSTSSGRTGAATDAKVNRSNNGGDYNASSNSVAPAAGSQPSGAAPSDPSSMPAERPAKPDRN